MRQRHYDGMSPRTRQLHDAYMAAQAEDEARARLPDCSVQIDGE